MPPSDILSVEIAYMMAKHGHRAQVRKELDEHGNPVRYFEHPRRVAIVLMDELDIHEPQMLCAALLHDALEDTKDITAPIIEHLFGKEVVQIVKLLSKEPKEGYYDRLNRFGNWKAWAIKGSDRLDNLRSLSKTTREFQQRQLDETRKVIYPLMNRLVLSAEDMPGNLHLVGVTLRDKIHNIVENFVLADYNANTSLSAAK